MQLVFFCLISTSIYAYGPLEVRAQNPLYLLFLTETPERGASSLEQNDWSLSLETTFSNGTLGERREKGIGLELDLESWRHVLKVRYGIFDRYSVGIDIPFLTISGGFLDPFIQKFHHIFGFPNGERDLVSNNTLTYVVTDSGRAIYKPRPSMFGLSDIIVSNKVQFLEESTFIPALSLKASLKLPTGQTKNATGSGGLGFAGSLYMEKSISRFHSYSLVGFSINDGLPELKPFLNLAQFTFSQSFEFDIFEYLSLVAQIAGNTSMFHDVKITALKNPMLDLSVGLVGNIPIDGDIKSVFYEFCVTEDPFWPGEGPQVDFSVFFKVGVLI